MLIINIFIIIDKKYLFYHFFIQLFPPFAIHSRPLERLKGLCRYRWVFRQEFTRVGFLHHIDSSMLINRKLKAHLFTANQL